MVTENSQSSTEKSASFLDKLITFPQYLLPQHLLSNLMFKLTRCQQAWFKNAFIKFIVKNYGVNLGEAKHAELDYYPSFNHFFTRELIEGCRTIEGEDSQLCSPVDGAISQIGDIKQGQILQAKGQDYSVSSLLAADNELAQSFANGQFATIYLSPKDYHRIHMPLTGKLVSMTYVPGKLFSVSPRTARAVPALFARNERVIAVFDTEYGQMAMILVGAIFVGSMETVWHGQVTPAYGKKIQTWQYENEDAVTLNKGEEMGRFNMGSTVILLLPEAAKKFDTSLNAEMTIKMGQLMN